MLKVMLADDHELVRQGVRALLDVEPDMTVIAEVGDGLEAVAAVERLQPDIVVVDLMLPGLGGLEVVRAIARSRSATRTVVLSMHSGEQYVLRALRNGALGYVLKESGVQTLISAIRAAAEGRRYLCPALAERAIEAYLTVGSGGGSDSYETLTLREREVFALAAEGLNNMDIAQRLSISPRTVEVHRSHVTQKLGLRSQTDLVREAMRRGMLDSAG